MRTMKRQGRAAVSNLCAACRREATVARPLSMAARAARPWSTMATKNAAAQSGSPKSWGRDNGLMDSRRWFSEARSPPAEKDDGSLSFYSLFPETLAAGPPPAGPFRVDVAALRREFLRLQAGAHPDLHGGSRGASAASALLNEAYRTLANPLARAQYLLHEKFGADMAGDEAGTLAEAEPEVLGAVLEAREQIEEAEAESELAGLRAENEERIGQAEEVLGRAFAEGDVEAAKREVVRLRYWVNVRESIDNWESGKPVVLQH